MKRHLVLLAAVLMVGLHASDAQAPQPQSQPSTAESQLQQLQVTQQLLFEKLHGITEFQQWLQVNAQIQQIQAQQQAQPAEKAKHPAATPAKK